MPTGVYQHKKTGPQVERVSFECETCNKKVELLPGEWRRRIKHGCKPKYCSMACSTAMRQMLTTAINIKCDNCGKEFGKIRSHLKERNYCGKECSDAARRNPNAKWNDKAQIKTYMQGYTARNREKLTLLDRIRVALNPEAKRERSKRYRESHRDQIQTHEQARRTKTNQGAFDGDDWKAMKTICGHSCLCCGKSEPAIKLTIDHIVPIVHGGPHEWANIQPLCKSCNCSKNTKTIDYRSAVIKRKLMRAVHGIEVIEV